jgi:hypothetical protein
MKTSLLIVKSKRMKISELSWSCLYHEVAINLHVRRENVFEFQCHVMEDSIILLFCQGEGLKQGPKEEVNEYHADGRTIIKREIRNYLRLERHVTISNATIGCYFKQLGLTWKKVSNMKRKVSEYQRDFYGPF